MKKSELKTVLKPIIEECLRESILENGVLGKIITEVFLASQGFQTQQIVEQKLTNLPEQQKLKVPKKDTPRLAKAKELEKQGYFDGISFEQANSIIRESSSQGRTVEGVGQVKTAVDDMINNPGIPEDIIMQLMKGKK